MLFVGCRSYRVKLVAILGPQFLELWMDGALLGSFGHFRGFIGRKRNCRGGENGPCGLELQG